MNYWLFKTEPDEFSIQQLASSANHTARWDGIRNYQARNFLRDPVQAGDIVLIYHGKIKQAGVVGIAQVVSPAYADPAQVRQNGVAGAACEEIAGFGQSGELFATSDPDSAVVGEAAKGPRGVGVEGLLVQRLLQPEQARFLNGDSDYC